MDTLQMNMNTELRTLCKIHGREKCAQTMGLSVSSVNNFLSQKSEQNITVEQFTLLYDTLTPEQPHIHLCYKLLETFECTFISAIRDDYQSRCEMMQTMYNNILYMASIDKVMCFVVSMRPYFEAYPLKDDQIIKVGPYYLADLFQSKTPGANELASKIQELRNIYCGGLEFVPRFKALFALKSKEYDGKYAKYSEQTVGSEYRLVKHNPTVFCNKHRAERMLRHHEDELQIVEFKPESAFYPVADATFDVPPDCLATEAGQWSEHFSTSIPGNIHMPSEYSEYHVVLINPKTGNAELWKDFVPEKELEQVKIEAEKAYPKCVCIVRDARQYPNPMTLVDECDGAIVEV